MISIILFSYFSIGVVIALVGCRLHANAWGFSFRESLISWLIFWVLAAMCWPLAVDLMLSHRNGRP